MLKGEIGFMENSPEWPDTSEYALSLNQPCQRPWRTCIDSELGELWSWGDLSWDIEKTISLSFEFVEDNSASRVINIDAGGKAFYDCINAAVDNAVNYVIDNPELYGLRRVKE